MDYFIFIFLGIVFIGLGLLLMKYPPAKNYFYGYRTRRAFLSDRNWYLAQKLGGKHLIISGVLFFVMLIVYIIVKSLVEEISDLAINIMIFTPMIYALISIFLVDRKLPDR